MILVDTTIWIDFFANRNTKQVITLIQLIQENQDLCICGVILTEILQGIKNPREHQQVENHLAPLKFLDMPKSTFLLAAEIYRTLRQHGFTVGKTIDCMIAAVAIENDVALLHHDHDFDPIEKHCGLYVIG